MASLLQLGTSFLPSSSTVRRPSGGAAPRRPLTRIEAKIREIFMPALSSTMTEGKIVSWVKSEGDKLCKGESVVVVESDKADMDVETFYDGYLAAIMVEEGGVAPVDSAIALLAETEDEIISAKSKASSSPTSSSSDSRPLPPPVAESPLPPVAVTPSLASQLAAVVSAHPASKGGRRIVATPYAKKLAKDLKVELGSVAGTGPMGRIVAKDVEAAAATPAPAGSSPAKISAASSGVELGSGSRIADVDRGRGCREEGGVANGLGSKGVTNRTNGKPN